MKTLVSARKKASLIIACAACLIASAVAPSRGHAQAQEEPMPKMIETFTLDQNNPRREFYDGRLKIELVSSKKTKDYMKSITVRISSDMLKAEYGDEWQEHYFNEMTKYYVGDPVSGSPFKCNEGWFYYVSSKDGEVTLSLHEGVQPVDSKSYRFDLFFMKNWKYLVMAIGAIGLGFVLYYYLPVIWSFISIQIQARSHALATGFESSPVVFYILKRAPLAVCLYYFINLPFDYGWKGILMAVLIAAAVQGYFHFHNKSQLAAYARLKHFTAVEGSRNKAYTGEIHGMPVSLSLGGILVGHPQFGSSSSSSGTPTYMSFLVIQFPMKNTAWKDLTIARDRTKKSGWNPSMSLDNCPGADKALSALSRLPMYAIGSFEVIDGTFTTVKVFAPDTPAEIHLVVDLVADLALCLQKAKR